jgi:hypothetical protein
MCAAEAVSKIKPAKKYIRFLNFLNLVFVAAVFPFGLKKELFCCIQNCFAGAKYSCSI